VSGVTQADLDAAADLIEQYWSGSDANMIRLAQETRNGHRQGAFPRAFARHREQSTAPLEAQIAVLCEALDKAFRADTRAEVKMIARAALAQHKGDA
jgi:hypothetical protein